jgi:tetratricopeptide (TPR) repeat protein
MLKERGVAALSSIRDLRDKARDIYIDEADINGIGYYFMNQGRMDDAVEIFRFNVEAFPESWNVYDSLAEAYMKKGDAQNAIKHYKKSLELNPDNNNAKEKLKELK